MQISEKTNQMLKSGDPELIVLAVSILLETNEMKNKQDFYEINGWIRHIPPSLGATFGKGFKQSTSIRKKLRIAAQKQYMKILRK